MTNEEAIQQGHNEVLYLLLAIGDENAAHDNWHPDKAQFLFETRQEIVKRLKHNPRFPKVFPDFENYTWRPG